MTKILFIILVTLLLVLWFKHMARPRGGDGKKPPATKQAEDMVRCRVCGVNLPRSEALLSKGQFYCCDEHRLGDQ